jgi:hypothetical protein
VSNDDVACVPYAPNGGDVFYRVAVPYSYQLTVQASTATSTDPSLYLLVDWGAGALTCIAGSDAGFVDEDELVSFVNDHPGDPPMVTIVVDSWSARSEGEFTLAVSCEFLVPIQQSTWGALKAVYGE